MIAGQRRFVKGRGLRPSHIENGDLLPNIAGKVGGQALDVIYCVEHDRILKMLSMQGCELARQSEQLRTVGNRTR